MQGRTEMNSRFAEARYAARPLVCLTAAWEDWVRARYPRARVYKRCMMKPARLFRFPEARALPAGYRLAMMDEEAFGRHPFSHGERYPSYAAFRAAGSGAVAYREGEIVASASSFLSLDGEVELDVSTQEAHRGRGLAAACIELMLKDCMERGIAVHWDAQNEISRRLAEKFGFEVETDYPVFWLTEGDRREEEKPVAERITIGSERLSADEYIGFLKRTDLGSQYPRERFEERIARLVDSVSISLAARNAGGLLVGALFGLTDYAYWLYVTDLGVDRDYERQGIGRRLMKAALELAGGEKDIAVYLVANENAVPFYEKLGMEKADDVMRYSRVEWTDFTVR